MDRIQEKRSPLVGVLLAVCLAPIAVAFLIVASLAAGPSEVFKAVTNRN